MTRMAMARALARTILRSALVFSMAALATPVGAQQFAAWGAPQARAKVPAAKPVTETSKAIFAQLGWLTGSWQGQWGPRLAQQVWLPAQSGTMVGVFQVSENARTLVIELYTIVSTSHGVELRVRHFTPSLTAWEKSAPALLDLQSIDSKSIDFENANDGQPRSWVMKRTGADTFIERFEIVPASGQEQIAEIAFHRQPAAAPANH